MAGFYAGVVLGWLLMGAVAAWVATQRSRSGWEGFGLGLVLGPLAIVVELLLPEGFNPDHYHRARKIGPGEMPAGWGVEKGRKLRTRRDRDEDDAAEYLTAED